MNAQSGLSKEVLDAFGIKEEPALLKGGQGITWRVGKYIVKPTINEEETIWCAEIIGQLSQDSYRVPRYKKTQENQWVYQGWSVVEFIEGEHIKNHWEEKISACEGFSNLLTNIPKPNFIEKRTDPWSIASRMAWGEAPINYVESFKNFVDKINKYIEPTIVKDQIVHGDIAGNMLFAKGLTPGIIDFTPIWRPKEYALAVLVVDALAWEEADESIIILVEDVQNIFQLLLKAALFRALATSEYHMEHNIDRPSDIEEHERTLNIILNKFKTGIS